MVNDISVKKLGSGLIDVMASKGTNSEGIFYKQ